MIKVTRLNGSELYINPDHIEVLEETPDTHITLSNDHRFVVLEKIGTIKERIITYNATILRRAGCCVAVRRRHRAWSGKD